MHNINLQRVDRITMALGLEARTPFLDRDLIAFAQTIPASLKMKVTETGATIEKWILRKACEDLLPAELVWRKKAQFDEGSGTVDALAVALARYSERDEPLDREAEAGLYRRVLCEQYQDPALVLGNAGQWAAHRVAL
jgi:asparagine synthase (glutamine-hydrolysing)